MKLSGITHKRAGFTLVELLVTIVIIGILAAILLPTLAYAKKKVRRVQCINNLKQIGTVHIGFANDNRGRLPWQLLPNLKQNHFGNSYSEKLGTLFSVSAIKSELGTAETLHSPLDPDRHAANKEAAANWVGHSPHKPVPCEAISYNLVEGADTARPTTILSTTRNLSELNLSEARWVGAEEGTRYPNAFANLNKNEGNMVLADGSASQSKDDDLMTNGKLVTKHIQSFGGITKGVASTRVFAPTLQGALLDKPAPVPGVSKPPVQQNFPKPKKSVHRRAGGKPAPRQPQGGTRVARRQPNPPQRPPQPVQGEPAVNDPFMQKPKGGPVKPGGNDPFTQKPKGGPVKPGRPTGGSLEHLYQGWTHSREEQPPGIAGQIFRPTGSRRFPPSRFRMRYVFHKNGGFEWLYLHPGDRHHMKSGSWRIDPKDNKVIHAFDVTGGKVGSLRILELKRDLLRLAAVPTPQSQGQTGAAIEWIPVPDKQDYFYMAQRTPDGKLLLTPNESFFPKLGLRAEGEGKVIDIQGPEQLGAAYRNLNDGRSYKMITRWDRGDQAEWGLWFEETGALSVQIWMSKTTAKSRFTVSLNGLKKTFPAGQTGEDPRVVATLPFKIEKPGRHSLIVTCDGEETGAKSQLHAIEITGPAAKNSAVLRKRWRPAAAHTEFSSSRNPNNVHLWIMEMDAKPSGLWFFSPITTPFGYYGPLWLANGIVGPGFNFSLWSYGRGQPEPPIERLSHLIAIGNPLAEFGGFGSEGTGVKIRNWLPLTGRQGQRQTMALRVQPGPKYDTYTSFFFANDDQRWHLLGVGKKYNKNKPLKSLRVGSFVEVPGGPWVQRTGAYERQMRYRGWTVDANGTLYPLDRMAHHNIDRSTGMTHTDRGITKDGRFFLQTGGWAFRKGTERNGMTVSALPTRGTPKVAYLDPEDIAFLRSAPYCKIVGKEVKRTDAGAVVTFSIQNLGENPEVDIHWGDKEALTFADRWANKVTVSNPREGKNQFVLKNVPPAKPLFVRLFLKNREGQFWSMDTLKASGGVVTPPQKPGTPLWKFTPKSWVGSSPAIGVDGTVYVGSHDYRVYALDGRTGAKKWEFKTGNIVYSSPAIGADGTVYIGSVDKKVYALNGRTGGKKWEFKTKDQVWASPSIGPDGTVYIGSFDHKVYALDGNNGAKKWEYITEGKVSSSPAVGDDGTIYFGSHDKKVYALKGRTGVKKWEFKTRGGANSSPAIGSEGTVYVGSDDKYVYALDGQTGARKWRFRTGLYVRSSPAIGPFGTVYIGSFDRKVYALDGRTGTKKWEFTTGSAVDSSPAIGADGTIYVGSHDKKVYALDVWTGTKKWEFKTRENKYGVRSSPVIGVDGTVYVGSYDGEVYAIASSSKGLVKCLWPMRGQNPQHTGRTLKK